MSKKSLFQSRGKQIYARFFTKPSALPFSFEYDGTNHEGLGDFSPRRHVTVESGGKRTKTEARIDENLKVTFDAFFCEEFGEVEYTVYFENDGKKPSGVLKNVFALDFWFKGARPYLRGCLGDHENSYAAYGYDFAEGDRYFLSESGRATHVSFPYFDLVHGAGGTLLALGWAGTWECLFSPRNNVTHVKARTSVGLETVLLPGESVRTGLVVMLPYRGRNADDATNLWREWFMKYNLPKADAEGHPLQPFSTAYFALDTGLPNSDGSISERNFTWKPTLDKLVKERILPDFRWFDAGWYLGPFGESNPEMWWETVGSWTLDHEKWPGDSFRESNEACHKLGMKVFMWFEPERVTHLEGLVPTYGYKEEWGLGEEYSKTNDIGDPECFDWTLKRILRTMDEGAVDMYREDNNADSGRHWPYKDRREAAALGLPRSGITENKCIVAHYRLWDAIIDHCRKNGKCTFVDSCASGGGRNDIESMRRGVPVMRSDADRTTPSLRLSQSSTFCRWVPFHGSSTKETAFELDPSTGPGSSPYVARASFLPIWNMAEAFTHNPALDYDLMRRNFYEWKSIRHLLVRDMYVLTPWHHKWNREDWTVFAYDAPDLGESVLLAFRMEDNDVPERRFALPFAQEDATYEAKDADTGAVTQYSGADLRKGIVIRLDEPKSCAMITFRRK